MYDAAQGRFISRDPLGYVDGMSLYGGYFAPRNADSTGLCQEDPCDEEPSWTLKFNPATSPIDVPWSRFDFGVDIMGLTASRILVDCGKEEDGFSDPCIKCNDGTFRLKGPCVITVEFHILLNVKALDFLENLGKRTRKGVYGHEQLHVRNEARAIWNALFTWAWGMTSSPTLKPENPVTETMKKRQSKDDCAFASYELRRALFAVVLPVITKGSTHDNGNPNYDPGEFTDYEPQGQLPDETAIPEWASDFAKGVLKQYRR